MNRNWYITDWEYFLLRFNGKNEKTFVTRDEVFCRREGDRFLNYLVLSKYLKPYKNGYNIIKEIPFHKTTLSEFKAENECNIMVGEGSAKFKMKYTFSAWSDVKTYINTIDVGTKIISSVLNEQIIFLDDKTVRAHLNILVMSGVLGREGSSYIKILDIKIPANITKAKFKTYMKDVKHQRNIKLLKIKQRISKKIK